ncbi:MAG: c-type cytochrome [Rhodocyclales bacterium]|nr:c-type cytochrome [Rhodocyclales bacterium]
MSFIRPIVIAAALSASAATAVADAKLDAEMGKLAAQSGCVTCHSISPKPGPDGLKPIGPAWEDVARKYQGQPKAAGMLTHLVMEGTSPYNSHWKDKVSGLSMPPNAVAIKEADARKLVNWILSLAK